MFKITQNQGLGDAIILLEDQLGLFPSHSKPESLERKFLCVMNCLISGSDTRYLNRIYTHPKKL
jgi:hypothetical protein